MIVDVKKYVFVGVHAELEAFFAQAQEEGYIEFIPGSKKSRTELPAAAQNLISAIKILKKIPSQGVRGEEGDEDRAEEYAESIVELRGFIDQLQLDVRMLETDIARVAPFGDFSKEDIAYIEKQGQRVIQFFCMKTAKTERTLLPEDMLYIATEYDLDYFVSISSKRQRYPDMIEMYVETPVGALREQLAFVQERLKILEDELKTYVGQLGALKHELVRQLNRHHLSQAKSTISTPLNQALFAVEAFVPTTKLSSLASMMKSMAVHVERIALDSEEIVPTYMENKGLSHLGEDLVGIYDVPATEDKDPSLWVFWAFILFFSMIVADAGYGLIFLGITGFLKYKFSDLKGSAKRMLNLAFLLSCGCVLWGILISSYFAMHLSESNLLSKMSLIKFLAEKKAAYEGLSSVSQKDILLELSLLIGVIHISISLLRYVRSNLAGLGWVVFLVGAYLYFPTALKATTLVQFLGWIGKDTAGQVGIQLIYIGVSMAVVLALLQKRLKGLGEVMQAIQVFADVLSYLRLYALALASTIMAETFNTMGSEMGVLVGAIVIFLGHSVNILIGTMGGVIHGLRLNFVEWYRYSFYGGGKLLQPLKKINP